MSYQKCPVCNGVGQVTPRFSNETLNVCTVCEGKQIISELTGNPLQLSSRGNVLVEQHVREDETTKI